MKTWFWHEGEMKKRGTSCDFDKMRLTNVFQGLGLNTQPRFQDDGQPAGGDNDCLTIEHYDAKDYIDPSADKKKMKPYAEQKYKVGEKEYKVRHHPGTWLYQ
jgi:hypothetical protein